MLWRKHDAKCLVLFWRMEIFWEKKTKQNNMDMYWVFLEKILGEEIENKCIGKCDLLGGKCIGKRKMYWET